MAKTEETIQTEDCCCGCSHTNNDKQHSPWKQYLPSIISFVLLTIGLVQDFFFKSVFFSGYIRVIWYAAAYIPVGLPVIKEAFEAIKGKDFFNEFTLMAVATLGAFFIGEYPEAVAVMLFYSVGELFQESAVNKARRSIKALLDVRPDTATVLRKGTYQAVDPKTVIVGETIQVKVGEKVPLDGILLSDSGSFNTSALTGESVPRTIREEESVLAGMINLNKVVEIQVEKVYDDSTISKVLEMVQNATAKKAKTELLIRRFARIYTPIIFLLAFALTVLPIVFVDNYIFTDWLYRAFVFLVISCPCALVVSVPLSYFGGIGAASRNGILFKGATYLDTMGQVNIVVMDKTGTLTEGVFEVQQIMPAKDIEKEKLVEYAAALEQFSNHPIAKAIVNYSSTKLQAELEVQEVEEIAGYGLKGLINGHCVMAGNTRLMNMFHCSYDKDIDLIEETIVVIAIDGNYAGYLIIADKVKEDASLAIKLLKKLGIQKTIMLSGDKTSITQKIARNLQIDEAYGNLLPEDKMRYVEQLKTDQSNVVAFVGDGINDSPVLALSDVGIAMGGMGAEVAIEVADIIIQTDQPSKIATAIQISRSTRKIVFQNIALAIGIKAVVLIMGAIGIATMWEAVFADVGVSLLAVLNAVKILKKRF